MRPGLTTILALALLGGCAGGQTLNRWTSETEQPGVGAAADGLRLFVSSAPVADQRASLSAKELPDHAGAALIAGMAAKEKTVAALRADVARPLAAPGGENDVDTTKAARVLLLGVQRGDYRPGDRLLATTITIKPVDGVRFTDYSLAATDRSAINIGTVSVTNQQGANIGVTPGPLATLTEGLSAGYTASRGETGTRNIVNDTELSVHVAPEEIEAYRTGAEGLDLTGNTLIKLAVQLPNTDSRTYTIGSPILTGDDGAPLKPDKAKIATSRITLDPARDIYVCAMLTYTDRVIVTGRERYDEGRQSVSLRTGASPWTPYLIIPYQDLETPLWVVKSGHSVIFFDDRTHRTQLTFGDLETARDFTHWLAGARQAKLANGELSAGTSDIPEPIAFDDLGVARLQQTQGASRIPNCQ